MRKSVGGKYQKGKMHLNPFFSNSLFIKNKANLSINLISFHTNTHTQLSQSNNGTVTLRNITQAASGWKNAFKIWPRLLIFMHLTPLTTNFFTGHYYCEVTSNPSMDTASRSEEMQVLGTKKAIVWLKSIWPLKSLKSRSFHSISSSFSSF